VPRTLALCGNQINIVRQRLGYFTVLAWLRRIFSRIKGIETPFGGVSFYDKDARIIRTSELKTFQERFQQANLEDFWDMLLEAEDLLESIVGTARFESYAVQSSQIILARCQAQKSRENGNEAEAASHESLGLALLDALKARIGGIH